MNMHSQSKKRRRATAIACALMACMFAACDGSSSDDDGDTGGGGNVEEGRQRDRMGQPAVNTALVASSEKDGFNQADPSTDPGDYQASQTQIIRDLRAAVAAVPGFPPEDSPGVPPEAVVSIVNPDTLRIDLSAGSGFPNGRDLDDDTINPVLGLVLNRGGVASGGPGVSDGIDAPKPGIGSFPYAGPPIP